MNARGAINWLMRLGEERPGTAEGGRAAELFSASTRLGFLRAHGFFEWLLPAQWISSIVAALWVRTPAGVGESVFVGAICTVPAVLAIRRAPYAFGSRALVALSQAGFSVLLIHLSHGRIEAHYHLFASLVLLSLYRDARLLPIAAAVVLAHHAVAIHWWPAGLFGVQTTLSWRLAEEAGWLMLEIVVLWAACVISRREMRALCEAQANNEQIIAQLEDKVRERTHVLQAEVAAREHTETELRRDAAHYRDLIASVPIGIFETTRSGRVNFANAHMLSLVGLPAHIDPTAINMGDGRIFPVSHRERLWNRLENEQMVRGFVASFRHFDGSAFDVVINARLKRTAAGEELVAEGTVEDISARKRAERELEALHSQLLMASRQAGMAEVATGVLHNVGNVLTSVNLIVHDVQDRLKTTRLAHLRRVVELIQKERERLGEFFTTDPTGQQIPDFLSKLDSFLAKENQQLLADVDALVRHFEHIREIIVTQQGAANLFGVIESIPPAQLIEDALRLNAGSLERHGIILERVVETDRCVRADRHKVLQILVNLMKNARDAMHSSAPGERRIRVAVTQPNPDTIALSVTDNGVGITREDITRIFQHGYTTKTNGHGFGLHSSVLAAREMHGDLAATSAGRGQGSTFTLTLPAAPGASA